MKAFIKDELKKRNIQLDNRAVDQLSAKNFSNRLTLINEIDKISTILTSDNHDTKIIDELIDETRRESFDQTYNLMNYINNKDLKSCLLELKKTKFTENIFLDFYDFPIVPWYNTKITMRLNETFLWVAHFFS